ncbi:MAG: hypothetical protein JWN55_1646 [Frankiales bacterium]|nr:hypothetical protein [Frankiales bacterium]
MTEMLCGDCDAIVLFVTPECDDGQDCGDLMCVLCGAAVTFGGLLVAEEAVRRSAAA